MPDKITERVFTLTITVEEPMTTAQRNDAMSALRSGASLAVHQGLVNVSTEMRQQTYDRYPTEIDTTVNLGPSFDPTTLYRANDKLLRLLNGEQSDPVAVDPEPSINVTDGGLPGNPHATFMIQEDRRPISPDTDAITDGLLAVAFELRTANLFDREYWSRNVANVDMTEIDARMGIEK